MKNIIFNYLPPAALHIPSIAFNSLKSPIDNKKYDVKTIYWNEILYNKTPRIKNSDQDFSILLPYLLILASENPENFNLSLFKTYLHVDNPGLYLINEKKILDPISKFNKYLDSEINHFYEKNIKDSAPLLIGFTSKFYQWIPAYYFARKIKKKDPKVPIVIGGFGSKEIANSFSKILDCFDYFVYGEGELPLLKLINYLEKSKSENIELSNIVVNSKINESIKISEGKECIEFRNYKFPDHLTDYNYRKNQHTRIPINSIRGCYWNRCKFCSLNKGYSYRERDPENIIAEIEYHIEKYNIYKFIFIDSNVVGHKIVRFIRLLDLLIELNEKVSFKLDFIGEIIPCFINKEIIEKISLAGFTSLQIGYEALSDKLLKKINKRNTLSDNIFFVKIAAKYKLEVGYNNLISSIPNETEEDLVESLHNIHFLRFLLSNKSIDFRHNYITLSIDSLSRYYFELDEDTLKDYNKRNFEGVIPNVDKPQPNRDFFISLTHGFINNNTSEKDKRYFKLFG